MSLGLSSHGTLIATELAPITVNVFTTIGELGGDIMPPAFTRPMTEITPHNDTIDAYIGGVRKRGDLTFGINFRPSGEVSHGVASGLMKLWGDGIKNGWRLTYTDGHIWIMSGLISNIAPRAPVREGALTADVTMRPTGPMKVDTVTFS